MAKRDNRLDRLFLGVMLAAPPFHRFFVHSPEELGLPERTALENIPGLEPVLWAGLAGVAVAHGARLWERIRLGEPLNPPKLLLLAAIVPLCWLTFAFLSWQAATPTVTIVHNLQYHALIWFHNRNRYGNEECAAGRFCRIPAAAGRSLAWYAGLAIVFSALYRAPGFHLGRISDLAFGLFCGFGLTHDYLDSKIWRVRHDPSLRETLRLA